MNNITSLAHIKVLNDSKRNGINVSSFVGFFVIIDLAFNEVKSCKVWMY